MSALRTWAVPAYPLRSWIKAYTPAPIAPGALPVMVDAPTVTNVWAPYPGLHNLNSGTDLEFYVDFSEPVKVVLANGRPYLEVTIGSQVVHANYVSGSNSDELEFVYTVQLGDSDDDGIEIGSTMHANTGALVAVSSGVDVDPVMQGIDPDEIYVYVSGIVPTVTLTPNLPAKVSGPFTVTATFSESVSDFSIAGFNITNGVASNFVMSEQNKVFTVLVTPNADGPLTIIIPEGAGNNVGHNNNSPSNQLSTIVDQTAPVVNDVKMPADNYYNATNTLNFTIDFSENVFFTGALPSIDVHIGTQTVKATYASGSGGTHIIFSYAIQPGQEDMDGITLGTVIDLNGGTILDDAGNAANLELHEVGDGANVRVNTTHPTVSLATNAPAVIKGPYDLTVDFSEAVYGLIEADFTVTNGNVTNLQTTDNIHYTFTITPATPDLPVTVSLPADVAENIGHNGNLAATNTVSVQFDPTAPTVTAVTGPANDTYLATETMDFTVTFSEAVYVTGSPYLEINIGGSVVHAAFLSSAANSLIFRYTVVDGDNDADGVTPGSLVLNGGTIADEATNDAGLTLQNIADLTQVLVNTKHPTVVISGPAQANADFPVNITFSEAMGAVSAADLIVDGLTGASVQSLTTTDHIHYTATVSLPAGSLGNLTLQLPEAVVKSEVGNFNQASNILTVNIDNIPPVITTVTVPADGIYQKGQTLTFKVKFSEPVTLTGPLLLPINLDAHHVQANYQAGSGTNVLTFSYTVQLNDLDMNGIELDSALNASGATLRDAMGNDADLTLNDVGGTSNIFVNAVRPTVTIATPAAAVTGAFTITITFSEYVLGLTTAGISVTNATVSNLQTLDNITYTAKITPLADGAITVVIPANVALNMGNNGNIASNTISTLADVTIPVITAVDVPANGVYNSTTGQLTFTVHYSENVVVTGTPTLGIMIGSQTVHATYTAGSGTKLLTFQYTVQDGDQDMDGITLLPSLDITGATIADPAGNPASLTLQNVASTSGVFVNTQHPSVILSGTPGSLNAPFQITATFSQAVTGLTLSDFVTDNASLSNLQTTNNIIYTLTVTPLADGTVNVSLPANAAVNIGNNGNTASNLLSTSADVTAPVITQVAVPANGTYNATGTLTFQVHYSEPVVIIGVPVLPVIIGTQTVQASYVSGSGTDILVFSYAVQDGNQDMDGIALGNSLVLNTATIKDVAGNTASLTLQNVASTTHVLVNTQHTTVTLTTAASLVNGPFTVTVTFSEAVTGLALSDFVVGNASLSNLQTSDNITYTILVSPATTGAITLSLPAGMTLSAANNINAASNQLGVDADITAPVITQVEVPATHTYHATNVLTFTVHYSENVVITGTPQLPVIIGAQTVQANYMSGSGSQLLVFTYTIQNGENDADGIALGTSLGLNGGAITDEAGNTAGLTLQNVASSAGVLVNTQHPSVVIAALPASPSGPFTCTITFSEAVTGLTLIDFALVNGSISNLQTSDNITYTVQLTPNASGTVSISLPADKAVNVGDNGNTASNVASTTADLSAPYITSVAVPANGTYNGGSTLQFTVTFNKNVVITGAPTLPVIIGSKTGNADLVGGSGTTTLTFQYQVQEGDYDMDGIALGSSIALNTGTIEGLTGITALVTLQHIGNTSQVFVNAIHPSVTLTGPAKANGPFTITITFSEAVTGLLASEFVMTSASASNLQTTDHITYTLQIQPLASGAVTIDLPADMAQNIGNNGNTASNTLSIRTGLTPPVIHTPLTLQVEEHSPVGTFVGTPSGISGGGLLQQWTIVTDNSGAFGMDPSTGKIVVKDMALLDAKVATTVTITVTVSDDFNTSLPATILINVVPVINKAPVLDPVAEQQVCVSTGMQSLQLSGVSPVEAGQTLTCTISAGLPYFNSLTISNTGLISYQLKPGVSGHVNLTVTLKDNGGTAYGGTDSLRITFGMNINLLPVVVITSPRPDSTISLGQSIVLTADAPGVSTYRWSTGDEGATLEARPTETTTYEVTATNDVGCSITSEYKVKVEDLTHITATNFLSPNGDGRNDKWIVRNLDYYPDNEVTIFDRAGRVVYYSKNYKNDWGGTANGQPLAEGTYYYVIVVAGLPPVKGFITIVRDILK
ncbi:gliding motility-associated C-terminal domain-containing protein [Chitinophaga costaii]|uniref:Gliding motility-associated C-terminal domain-containing protein n=2 Tax=Chitinophaga costaii TaxID=1335309 RepID=A0A1C3Z0V7_9BACT|nr:gliding motility-associated C-terminal domain-containing protein [Chitinophaga costaii]